MAYLRKTKGRFRVSQYDRAEAREQHPFTSGRTMADDDGWHADSLDALVQLGG